MLTYLRRYVRHLGVALLLLALAACGPTPTKPAPQVSPYADVQFALVDELCDLLDHNRLMDLAGSIVTTDERRPTRPDVERRMCAVFATTPEKTSLAYLRIGTSLRAPEDEGKEEDRASLPRGEWSPIPGIGDSANFQYVARDELIDAPTLNRPVRSLDAWLITQAGNARISLHLMFHADIEFDRGEIEELLSEYAREALELMRS